MQHDERTVAINMTDEDIDALADLARAQGLSMTDALRKAIRTARFLERLGRPGVKLLLIRGRRRPMEVVL